MALCITAGRLGVSGGVDVGDRDLLWESVLISHRK